MSNNKQQTEINAVEYLSKVNQFAKENNTGKPKQQTAVDYIFSQLPDEYGTTRSAFDVYQQAKEMEKEQIINAFLNGDNTDCTSEQNIEEFADQYYEQTYGDDKQ
jgi:hypothetical protein